MIYQESLTNASTFIRLAGKIRQVLRLCMLLVNHIIITYEGTRGVAGGTGGTPPPPETRKNSKGLKQARYNPA